MPLQLAKDHRKCTGIEARPPGSRQHSGMAYTPFAFGHNGFDNAEQKVGKRKYAHQPDSYWRSPLVFGPRPGPRRVHLGTLRDITKATFVTPSIPIDPWWHVHFSRVCVRARRNPNPSSCSGASLFCPIVSRVDFGTRTESAVCFNKTWLGVEREKPTPRLEERSTKAFEYKGACPRYLGKQVKSQAIIESTACDLVMDSPSNSTTEKV